MHKRYTILINSEGMWVTRNITLYDKGLSFFANNIITLSCSVRKTSYLQIAAVFFFYQWYILLLQGYKRFYGNPKEKQKTYQMTYIHPSFPSIHITLLVWYSYMLALKVFPSPKWCTNNTSPHTSPVFPSVLLYASRPRFLPSASLGLFYIQVSVPRKKRGLE